MPDEEHEPAGVERTIFLGALDRAAGKERSEFVGNACRGNDRLRKAVEALLQAHLELDEGFLESPIVAAGRSSRADRRNQSSPSDRPFLEEQPGDVLGDYEILRVLEEDRRMIVFEARSWRQQERSARLRILKTVADTEPVFLEFQAQLPVLSQLRHRGVARVREVGITNSGKLYVAADWVDGAKMLTHLDAQKASFKLRVRRFLEVCEILVHAHERSIAHRNLSSNCIRMAVDRGKPFPVVMDFGLPGLFRDLDRFGERTDGERHDSENHRVSDLNALGRELFCLLLGEMSGESQGPLSPDGSQANRDVRIPSEWLESHPEYLASIAESRGEAPAELLGQLRKGLDSILHRLRSVESANGYGSVAELVIDLNEWLRPKARSRFGLRGPRSN